MGVCTWVDNCKILEFYFFLNFEVSYFEIQIIMDETEHRVLTNCDTRLTGRD